MQHRYNYITTNRFYVEMESQIKASFSECSGFGVNIKKESYLEGGVNNQQRIFLGHAEFDDITLKRGMSDDSTFWDWVLKTLTNPVANRRNVNILMFNQAGETMQAWTLIGAIPISWKAPSFQAEGKSVAIEELTLAYEGVKVIYKPTGKSGASIDISRDSLSYFPDR
jgi:phage tail-like protein